MSNTLSNDLIAQFAKATVGGDETKQDTTLRGTITRVVPSEGEEGVLCVKIDGSDIETPVSRFPSTIADFAEDDRVEVTVKNHALTITGNTTNPAIGVITKNGFESRIEQTEQKIELEVLDENTGLASRITQLSNKIETEVLDKENGLASKITQNAAAIETYVGENGEFTKFKQTVEGFAFMNQNGEGVKIDGGDINLSGTITISDLADDTASAIIHNTIKYEYSSDNENWHETMEESDIYRRESYDGGDTWKTSYQFRGTDGKNGSDGSDGSDASVNYDNIKSALTRATSQKAITIISDSGVDTTDIYANNIYGGNFYSGYGGSTFANINSEGFYVYHTDTEKPKITLSTDQAGENVDIILGAGDNAGNHRFYVEKTAEQASIYFITTSGVKTGFGFNDDGTITVYGTLNVGTTAVWG